MDRRKCGLETCPAFPAGLLDATATLEGCPELISGSLEKISSCRCQAEKAAAESQYGYLAEDHLKTCRAVYTVSA
ncbi:MAG: hypothetical protein LBP22_13685 [Deltaproteobacteria bacterium]|jgi:hypothetical protein|nr:hypothetical protein [Deltaproteobacteria bacterium]